MQTMIPQKPRREAETRLDAMAVILIKQVKVRERMWRMQSSYNKDKGVTQEHFGVKSGARIERFSYVVVFLNCSEGQQQRITMT